MWRVLPAQAARPTCCFTGASTVFLMHLCSLCWGPWVRTWFELVLLLLIGGRFESPTMTHIVSEFVQRRGRRPCGRSGPCRQVAVAKVSPILGRQCLLPASLPQRPPPWHRPFARTRHTERSVCLAAVCLAWGLISGQDSLSDPGSRRASQMHMYGWRRS